MEMRVRETSTQDVGKQKRHKNKKQKSEKTEEVKENSIDFHVISENELEMQKAADTVLLQKDRP